MVNSQLTNVYVAGTWRSEFRYDAFGRRRIRKEYGWQSAWVLTNEVRYIYDGMLVVQERHFNPQLSTLNPQQIVSYTRGNDLSGSLQGAGGIGGLLARTDNNILLLGSAAAHAYYHCDGNGNVTALVNTNGIIVARYNYDPYGNTLSANGPLADANLYRFSSKEWHGNSGLYYFGFRYYEPNLQRWITRDPLGEAGGINLYEFANSAPIDWVDPWGEQCWNPFNREFWADLFYGNKKPQPPEPNSNRALLNEEGITPGTFTDENGNEISAGKCTALICGAVVAGTLTAVTDGLGSGFGKGEKLGSDALKAKKEIDQVRKAENALDKLKDIEKAQQKVRKNQFGGKAIDDISKSRQNANKLLRDIRNDPSCVDDL